MIRIATSSLRQLTNSLIDFLTFQTVRCGNKRITGPHQRSFSAGKGGDCEDFVVGKYFTLRALGIEDKHLFLTYVKAIKQNVAHMVLTYHSEPGSIPLVLDNYNPVILPASARLDLVPVYSFNAESLFLSNPSAGLDQSLPTDKIKNSKWDALLSSMKETSE